MSEPASAWYEGRWPIRLLLAFLALYLAQNAVTSMFLKVTDFEWHLDHARRLLEQRPYDPRFVTYLPPRFLLNAVYLPLGDMARPLGYLLALTLLGWTLRLWDRLLERDLGADRQTRTVALLWALVILSEYLGRDLNDCGPGIVQLFCVTLALRAQLAGRFAGCGFWLALAFAWKTTPLLFLPYLLLKRAWRSATWFVLFALLWLLLPAAVIGWEALAAVYRDFLEGLLRIVRNADLSFLGFEEPRHQNQGLRALFARYIQGFPADHPIHRDYDLSAHPLFVQFLALPPPWPARLYQGAVLALGLVFAWLFRRPWQAMAPGRRLAEWSVLPLIAALLSPLVWLHHFMVALPALWLSLVVLVARRQGATVQLAVGFIALVAVLLQRDLLQRELSVVELSYKLDALAMMLLIGLVLWQAQQAKVGTPAGRRRSEAA